jgi:hypothetical protein
MPDIDPIAALWPGKPRQIVLYGSQELFLKIREHARRDSMTASTWMRRAILDRLRAETDQHPTK